MAKDKIEKLECFINSIFKVKQLRNGKKLMLDILVPVKKYRIFTVDEAKEDEDEGTYKGSPEQNTNAKSPEMLANQYN